ncbi:MAG TPA: putative Ig domain-containing protein, partial [Planctomycetota bacterium]|nr:putative Ig domain-containing protein [Planctomycetota bacterium]
AGDKIEPQELATKEKVRQIVGAPDGTLFVLEGTVGYRNNQQGDDGGHKILTWDLEKNQEASTLKDIPDGAVFMAAVGTKLVVACRDNGAAIVDVKSRAVKRVKTDGLLPYYVSPDSPPGKALLLCDKKGGNYDRSLIEVDLEEGSFKYLLSEAIMYVGHVAASKDMVVMQGEFSHSPSARPDFYSLSELRKNAKGDQNQGQLGRIGEPAARSFQNGGRSWHESFGMWRVVNGGANFVATEEGNGIICLPSDCNRVLWTAEKHGLVEAHPTKPLLVAIKHDENARVRGPGTGSDQWKLVGLHAANGKQIWSTTVQFEGKVERSWREDPALFGQTIVTVKDKDRLLFAMRDANDRSGGIDAEPTWYFVDLPKADLSACPVLEGDPPATVRVTETYTFSPRVTNGDKATFSLAKAPDGMQIDSKSARITWKPNDKVIGKHDVEVSAKVGSDEFPVLSFVVKVTPADEFPAVEWDWGDLVPAQIACSEDGASIFVLEARKQPGGMTPPSRIVVWDVEKKRIEKSINVPKSPESMMMVAGKLLVSCPDSQVVAIIDPKEKKVTKSVPIMLDGQSLTPRAIFRDGPPGKAVVACGNEQGFGGQSVEVDLASGKVSPLYFGGGGRGAMFVAVAKDYAVWSDGSSTGGVSKLSELRKAPAKGKNQPMPQMDAEERQYFTYGARAVNGGANFAATNQQGKTALLTPDWKKVLWTVDGTLVQVHPTKPALIVVVFDQTRHFESDTLTLRGINSQSNRQMWQLVVKLPGAVRMDYWSFARGTPIEVRPTKDGEELLFCAGQDPFGRVAAKWYHVALPNTGPSSGPVTVSNEPPTEVCVGDTFEWAPTVKGASPSFVLKTAPDGMTLDAKTGKLTWKPDEACIGKYDVLLVAKCGQDEIPIAFELKVKPKGSGTSTPDKPKADDKPEKKDDDKKDDEKKDDGMGGGKDKDER